MNYTSPMDAGRALFKITINNVGNIPTTFDITKGNDENRFVVGKCKCRVWNKYREKWIHPKMGGYLFHTRDQDSK